jgi:hypothetical protein
MEPFLLTKENIKKAARAAYETGRLTAQATYHEDAACLYKRDCIDGVARVCAIGAALETNKEVLERAFKCGGGVRSIRDARIVTYTDEEEDYLIFLQEYHDRWARAQRYFLRNGGADYDYIKTKKEIFLKHLDEG